MGGASSSSKASDRSQDLISRFGPSKGLGLLVIDRDELPDGGLQLGHTAMRTALDLPLGEQGEPALDLIEPGSMRRSEVQMVARSFL